MDSPSFTSRTTDTWFKGAVKQLTVGFAMAGGGAFVSELKKPKELKDFLGYGLMVTGFGQVIGAINKIRLLEQTKAIYQGN